MSKTSYPAIPSLGEKCPRCHRNCLSTDNALNSLSHLDNKTYICAICGLQSGLCDMSYQDDPVEIEMHQRFKKELGIV